MKKVENIEETKDIQIGEHVLMITCNGGGIIGWVIGCYEYLAEGGKRVKRYKIGIGGKNYVDICETDIVNVIKAFTGREEFANYFKETYGIDLLDDEGHMRETSDIVNEVLIKDIWNKFDDEEKDKFASCISIDNSIIIDFINALDKSRQRNNELHKRVTELTDERTKTCNAVIEFCQNYDKATALMPQYQWAFDIIYKFLGVDKLLKEV